MVANKLQKYAFIQKSKRQEESIYNVYLYYAFLAITHSFFVSLQISATVRAEAARSAHKKPITMEHSIQENLNAVRASLRPGVRLIAVSKTKPVEDVQQAYDAGQRLFGENHALEMRDKHAVLPADIEWHFIGHLQSNKVKYIAEYVSMIHSIGSLPLLQVVEKEAAKHDRVIDCLLQFHIATEETKFGLDMQEAEALLQSEAYRAMRHVRIVGVMGMATNTENLQLVRSEFVHLREIFSQLKARYFAQQDSFREISMGMSHDYPIAMEEGSTMVRIGSAIFGARNYN